MRSLGYRHAAPPARVRAGGLRGGGGRDFVWWNAQIAPSTIDLTATIDVLLIAVIGGMFRLEAWVGALVFVLINNYAQDVGFVAERFHTLIGLIFLVIVRQFPDGLVGLWERTVGRLRGPSSPGETTGEEVGRRCAGR